MTLERTLARNGTNYNPGGKRIRRQPKGHWRNTSRDGQ